MSTFSASILPSFLINDHDFTKLVFLLCKSGFVIQGFGLSSVKLCKAQFVRYENEENCTKDM